MGIGCEIAIVQYFSLFEHIVDDVLNDKIDIAYRQKYAGSPYVEHMISTACRNATIEIIFVKKEAKNAENINFGTLYDKFKCSGNIL